MVCREGKVEEGEQRITIGEWCGIDCGNPTVTAAEGKIGDPADFTAP